MPEYARQRWTPKEIQCQFSEKALGRTSKVMSKDVTRSGWYVSNSAPFAFPWPFTWRQAIMAIKASLFDDQEILDSYKDWNQDVQSSRRVLGKPKTSDNIG